MSAALLWLGACGAPSADAEVDKPELSLMTSLPIFWSGEDAFAALSEGELSRHWARDALEQDYELLPIDFLDPANLTKTDVLLLAQPRALAPEENVALDNWVRGGGSALVLADPQLVGDYDLPLGDPRRPLDTSLLSPILARWGLELVQGDSDELVQVISLGESEMVVAAVGRFVPVESDGSLCSLLQRGIIAQCDVGAGRVVVLADATLLEDPVGGPGSAGALEALLGMARE